MILLALLLLSFPAGVALGKILKHCGEYDKELAEELRKKR